MPSTRAIDSCHTTSFRLSGARRSGHCRAVAVQQSPIQKAYCGNAAGDFGGPSCWCCRAFSCRDGEALPLSCRRRAVVPSSHMPSANAVVRLPSCCRRLVVVPSWGAIIFIQCLCRRCAVSVPWLTCAAALVTCRLSCRRSTVDESRAVGVPCGVHPVPPSCRLAVARAIVLPSPCTTIVQLVTGILLRGD